MEKFLANIAALIKVKSLVTLILTTTLAYLMVSSGTEYKEVFVAAYSSVMTYFFTRRDGEIASAAKEKMVYADDREQK